MTPVILLNCLESFVKEKTSGRSGSQTAHRKTKHGKHWYTRWDCLARMKKYRGFLIS